VAVGLSEADRKVQLALLGEFNNALRATKIRTYKPYVWQRDFHKAGVDMPERMLMAANRVGKTLSAGAELSYHMTGEYPDDWDGHVFEHPILAWTGSPTNETSRDIVQKELLGGLGEDLGTGWIPKDKIVGKPTTRQAGVKNVVESFQVRHISGGISTCNMKTYEMGWEKWQGTAPHLVWLDEEPSDYMIYSECQTRILTSHGRIMVTFTPLSGETELVLHFMGGDPRNGIYLKHASWDDAPHLSEEDKARLRSVYRAHELDARTKGIPMLGEGMIFTADDKLITVEPFQIPPHYRRIKGCDFGLDHPAAGVDCAWDVDADIWYLVDCYKKDQELAPYHAAWLTKTNRWIPVSWPHDGLNREKSGGKILKERYKELGANMLSKSARYPKVPGQNAASGDNGGPQPVEPIIDELLERMKSGRFKAFSTCTPFFEEKRSYHRKNGKPVAVRDDVLKALFYALMMKRYAVTRASVGGGRVRVPGRSIASMR
jgi:phage terminase large subunit-like protein